MIKLIVNLLPADWLNDVRAAIGRRVYRDAAAKHGMSRECPWCRGCVEDGDNHRVRQYDPDMGTDKYTCGRCGGESYWEFGPVPIFRMLGEPPTPNEFFRMADIEAREVLDIPVADRK